MDEKIKNLKTNEILTYTEELENNYIENNIPYELGYVCSDCGRFIPDGEDFVEVYDNRDKAFVVCNDCISDSGTYFYCNDCECWYFAEEVNSYTLRNGDTICEDCRNDHYIECERCGEIVHYDDAYYCEECDEHCHDENLLYDYHAYNDWYPQQTPEEPTPQFYIGHELEIDDGDLCQDSVDLITSKIPAVCMHDGSLSDSGIEMVSQPLSYNYMLSKEQDYRDLFSQLTNDYGYKSHNTETCGLHFHITRPENPDIIDRIILFMETYKEEIIQLSRRTNREINDWCNFLSDIRSKATSKEIKSLDYIKKNKETSTRYMALNLTNSRTIEFRIFKGTLKYETFMADFEFVYNLTTLASDLSLPIEEMTWTKVTSMGKFLPNYINEHNLHTDKPIIDYTTEIIVEKNKRKEQMKKELHTLYKKVMSSIHTMTKIDNRKKNISNFDISDFNTKASWLEVITRDLKNIDSHFENDYENTIDDIQQRINYIKERTI